MAPHNQVTSRDLAPRGKPQSSSAAEGKVPAAVGGAPVKCCPHCGKKFQGKPPAQCPVCFLSTETVQSDTFEHADPAFLRKLSWGAMMLALAIPLHVFGILLNLIGARELKALTHVLAALLVLGGVVLLTRRDAKFLERQRKTANWTRLWAAICAFFWLLLAYFAIVQGTTYFILQMFVVVTLLSQMALGWVLATFCQYLALRVPDDGLANSLHAAGCSISLICVVFIGFQVMGWTAPFFVIMATWPFPATPMVLGVLVWCTITVWRLAADLRACARQSEDNADRKLHPRRTPKFEAKIDL